MKFTISKEALLDGLQTTQSVVSTRTTLPVLSNVLLEATEEGLTLTTTDLDVGVRRVVDAQVERTGATTLPIRKLLPIIRELPSTEIFVETDAKQITTIRCGASFFKIYGMAMEEFPAFPSFQDSKTFTMKQADLKDGLKKTSYAISLDETRYVLNGILFTFKDNKLMLVATDGRRLALWETDMEFPQSQEVDLIVPTKAINELQRMVREEGDVVIAAGENMVSFAMNRTLLVSKVVDGTYPNYRQVIPGEAQERITLEREVLLHCVTRVSILSNDKTSSIRLNFAKNTLDITSNTPEVGEAQESLSIPYKGKEFSIAFNPDYLMAPLKNLSDDEVYLELIDEMSPGVLKIKSPFLYVLMPMRVSV